VNHASAPVLRSRNIPALKTAWRDTGRFTRFHPRLASGILELFRERLSFWRNLVKGDIAIEEQPIGKDRCLLKKYVAIIRKDVVSVGAPLPGRMRLALA